MNKVCQGCGRILLQGGVHMGIPFGKKGSKLLCAKCFDEEVVDDHKVVKGG